MKAKRLGLLLGAAMVLSACGNKPSTPSETSSENSVPTPTSIDAEEGDYPAIVEIDGVTAVENGNAYLAFPEKEGAFGVELHEKTGKGLISYNPKPIILRIQQKSSGLIASSSEAEYSAGYSTIVETAEGLLCSGKITTSNGGVIAVGDLYNVSYSKGITMSRVVTVETVGSNKDVGFASVYSLINGENDGDVENFEYLIPSILYKDTSNMRASAIANNLNLDRVYVKETRMGIPMAMFRSVETGYYTSLSHANPKISANGLVGGGGSGVADIRIQYGAFGYTMAKVSVDFVYPCAEGPHTYDAGSSWAKRYHPMEANVTHSYQLAIAGDSMEDFNHALIDSVEVGYSHLNSKVVESDNRTAYAQAIAAFNSEYRSFSNGASAGLPWELKLVRSDIKREYSFQMGFVGMQTSVGANLIQEGLYSNNSALLSKGETIIDFWCGSAVQANYFPYVWWDAGDGNPAGGKFRNYACYLRCMVDGMEGILDAYNYELDKGISKAKWLQTITTFADRLLAKQNEDGSFNRAYNYDGSVAINQSDKNLQGESKLNTPIAIKFLAKMYTLTKNEAYKTAVLKAAEFAYSEIYQKLGKYVGGTPDNPNVVDKEAAIYAMYGFVYAYNLTRDARFKDAMLHAASCSLTWTYMYDFACPSGDDSGCNPFEKEGHMIGFSIIATGHGAADNFSSFIWYELYKVYELTGLNYFKSSAILLQHCCKGSTDYDGEFGYLYNTMCPEATRVADFAFLGVKVWLPWCSIANTAPIMNMFHDRSTPEHEVWQLEDIVEE